MNIHPIKQIYKFNQEAGLLDLGYDDRKESAYPVEEMLETFVNENKKCNFGLSDLNEHLGNMTPKEISRYLMKDIEQPTEPSKVDLIDKHIDSIVFNFGSLFKLGLSPQDTMTVLDFVMEANLTKLSAPKDEHGKQTKPVDFVGPEKRIQKFLEKRELL